MSSPGADRLDPSITNLRAHAARGTLINSAFQVGLSGLGALQRVAVAAFLTPEEFGIWGIVLGILVTLVWLKQIGIADKYVQQDEPDQEAAFQKAFTFELVASLAYFVLVVLVIPLYAVLYGRSDIIAPAVVMAVAVPLTAFETPAWIAYRRLQYVRQRVLTATDPVVSFVATIALGVAGLGYWSLVLGILAGALAGAVVCTVTSPYRLRWRFERSALREYVAFSGPLLGGGLSRLIVVQGGLLAVSHTEGVATVGAIALAVSIAVLADRIDQIVSQTIYPAVCAVADRTELLFETFVKSNRIALMWAMPFAAGVALFARDGTRLVLGPRWAQAGGLVIAIALTSGVGQVAFNWTVFMRARNQTRPILAGALADLLAFLLVALPAILVLGTTGYVIGIATAVLVQLVVRQYFLSRLFPGFTVLAQLVRGFAPTLPAVGIVLALRGLLPGEDSLGRAGAELILFVTVVVGSTFACERSLLLELVGYLRGRRRVGAGGAA